MVQLYIFFMDFNLATQKPLIVLHVANRNKSAVTVFLRPLNSPLACSIKDTKENRLF